MNALFSVKAPGISSRKKCRTTSSWVTLSRSHKKICLNLTKLRVVFDASAATSTGKSLNDILLPGPCAYPLISVIRFQFRLHKFAITGDISKMFREVSLSPADRDLHRFLWRPQPGGPLREGYVTFGVASLPFLATQSLRQTAILITLRWLRSYFRSFM